MKKLITMLFLGAIAIGNAQVIIGNAVGTATIKTGVLLEFAAGQNKGIIVPYVRNTALINTPGTIILDASTTNNARVKYYNANTNPGSGGFVDLSGQGFDITSLLGTQPSMAINETGAKSIIGAATSVADGVLVLESTTKAMVLPTVTDVNNIIRPSPGMMVYVSGVAPAFNKLLAVFNGSKWSFFKP